MACLQLLNLDGRPCWDTSLHCTSPCHLRPDRPGQPGRRPRLGVHSLAILDALAGSRTMPASRRRAESRRHLCRQTITALALAFRNADGPDSLEGQPAPGHSFPPQPQRLQCYRHGQQSKDETEMQRWVHQQHYAPQQAHGVDGAEQDGADAAVPMSPPSWASRRSTSRWRRTSSAQRSGRDPRARHLVHAGSPLLGSPVPSGGEGGE